jgi:beta-glucosidase
MAAPFPFRDPELSTNERVEDLVARLTLTEKINQLLHENAPVARLGVPAYNWWNEPATAWGAMDGRRSFPR